MKKITKKMKKVFAKIYNLLITQKQAGEMSFSELVDMKWDLIYMNGKLVVKHNRFDFEDRYKRGREKNDRILPIQNWKIVEKSIDEISCHPSPEDFRPILKLNRKKKCGVLFVYDSEYKSNKHYNSIFPFWIDEKKCKSDGNSFYILINYELYRSNLQFGRKREFSFIAGYDDGSVFVNRVAPSETIDEALEKMKPTIVQRAEKEGKMVLRQGDVFFCRNEKG